MPFCSLYIRTSCINAGCSALNRKWSAEKFAQSARIIAAHRPDARFVLLGGPQDRDDIARLLQLVPKSVDAAGRLSLRASAVLIHAIGARQNI